MYNLQKLKPELIYIKWNGSPRNSDRAIEERFLKDLQQALDAAEVTVYIISDLRKGRISNLKTLQRLAALTKHANYGGSTAFSQNPVTRIFVDSFSQFSGEPPLDSIWRTPEEALAYLESLSAGVTHNVDWNTVLSGTLSRR